MNFNLPLPSCIAECKHTELAEDKYSQLPVRWNVNHAGDFFLEIGEAFSVETKPASNGCCQVKGSVENLLVINNEKRPF